MQKINDRLYNWASDIDSGTIEQAKRTARMPIVSGHVALMPDAHVGSGATVGSVIPTQNAIIPSAVGVDIGCGMIALETTLTRDDLPGKPTTIEEAARSVDPFLPTVETVVPAGVGAGNLSVEKRVDRWLGAHRPYTHLDGKRASTAASQLGSLGSGNHFAEICLDERNRVWLVLHSGSRGIGNQLAQEHIKVAKGLVKGQQGMYEGVKLEDPDLAFLLQGTDEFKAYITDMLWAQDYAMENRQIMMDRFSAAFFQFVGSGSVVDSINCHHNFTVPEQWPDGHGGLRQLWITRKGAIRADDGDRGVIPGSMGTRSFIVTGRGNPMSWNSCSHGAGRRMSRKQAKAKFTVEDLAEQMAGKAWLSDRAVSLLDEIPSSYKDVDQVMADQADLVKVDHTLQQILNFKGA